MEKKAILTWKAFAIFGAQAREVFSNIVSMAVAALLVVVFDLELVFGAVPPLLSFLLIVLHVEYSATIPFTSWPAFLLCPKEKPHSVSFLPIFLSLDSEVNQMPLPTLLSKNSIKYQINIQQPKDPLLTKSKTVKTNTQYYTIRWRKKISKYINFWQTFIP